MEKQVKKTRLSGKLKELASVLEEEKDPDELEDVTSQLWGMLEMCMQRKGDSSNENTPAKKQMRVLLEKLNKEKVPAVGKTQASAENEEVAKTDESLSIAPSQAIKTPGRPRGRPPGKRTRRTITSSPKTNETSDDSAQGDQGEKGKEIVQKSPVRSRKEVSFVPQFDRPRTRGKKITAKWMEELMPSSRIKKEPESGDEYVEDTDDESWTAKQASEPKPPEQVRKRGRPRKVQDDSAQSSTPVKRQKVSEVSASKDADHPTAHEKTETELANASDIKTTVANKTEVKNPVSNVEEESIHKLVEHSADEKDADIETEKETTDGTLVIQDVDHSFDTDGERSNEDQENDESFEPDDGEVLSDDDSEDEQEITWPKCFICKNNPDETFETTKDFAIHVRRKHCSKGGKKATSFLQCPEKDCARKTYMYRYRTRDVIRVVGQTLLHMMKTHGREAPPYVKEYECYVEDCGYTTVIQNALVAHSHFVHKHTDGNEEVCPYCTARAKPKSNKPTKHYNIMTTKQPLEFRCFFCTDEDKLYPSKLEYMNHFRKKHVEPLENENNKGTIACLVCGKKSAPFEIWRGCMMKLAALCIFNHSVRKHGTPVPNFLKVFKCDIEGCDFTTVLPRAMRDHEKSHKGELCDQCGKNLRYSMKEHKLFYCKMGPPPSEQAKGGGNCPECGKEYSNYVALKTHIRKVHKVQVKKMHPCGECDYQSRSISTLLEHQHQKHGLNSRQRPLVHCKDCPFTSLYGYALKEHRAIRHNDQDWPCKLCGKNFKQLSKLNQHMNHVHNHERPFKCDRCTYSAKTKFALLAHQKRCGQLGNRRSHMQPYYRQPLRFPTDWSKDGEIHVLQIPGDDSSGMHVAQIVGEEIIVQQLDKNPSGQAESSQPMALEFELTPEGYLKALQPGTSNSAGRQTLHVLEVSNDVDNDADLKQVILQQLGQQLGQQVQQGSLVLQGGSKPDEIQGATEENGVPHLVTTATGETQQIILQKQDGGMLSDAGEGPTIIYQMGNEKMTDGQHVVIQNPDGSHIILRANLEQEDQQLDQEDQQPVPQQDLMPDETLPAGDETIVRVIVSDSAGTRLEEAPIDAHVKIEDDEIPTIAPQ